MSNHNPQSIYEAFNILAEQRATGAESYPSIAVGTATDAKEVILSKDEYGHFNLLLRLPKEQQRPEIPLGKVLITQWEEFEEVEGVNSTFLRVICTDARLIRTFQSLVTEMLLNLYASVSSKPAIVEFIQVADAWRTVLQARLQECSLSEALGIFGELILLKKLVAINPEKALQAWRGTENYRHDFTLTNAIEVKTYTNFNEPKITVHGAHQLDPSTGHKLHLFALHVDQNEEGSTLMEIVEEINLLGVTLSSILHRLGKSQEALEEVSFRFVSEQQRLYTVDQSFPGIRASTVSVGALTGVSDVQYSLNLDLCGKPLGLDQLPEILREL